MSTKNSKKQILVRDGQNQNQRFPRELDPYYARIDDKTRKDLLIYAAEISKEINYYNTATNSQDGNWSSFFEKVYSDSIAKIKNYGRHDPHLALYLAFLLIYKHAQKSINNITKRHLDFYYKEILKLNNKKETPDKVHVIFELKKGIDEHLIEEGTYLNAGKDLTENALLYKTKNDIIVNNASIGKIKSVYVNEEKNRIIHFAPIANSKDGLGGQLDEGEAWDAFGNSSLQQADIGFAIASDILKMKEGIRIVKLHLKLVSINVIAQEFSQMSAYFTGEKGWIGPVDCKVDSLFINGTDISSTLSFELKADDELVTDYNAEIHGNTYETTNPLMQVLLNKNASKYSYGSLQSLQLKSIKVEIDVKGVKELDLENDQGKINYKKPFMPFGTEPVEGSTFYVGSEEIFSKNVDSFKLNVAWKNVPDDDLASYFNGYADKNGNAVTSNNYFQASLIDNNNRSHIINLFASNAADSTSYESESIETSSRGRKKPVYSGYKQILAMSNKWALREQNKFELTSKVFIPSLEDVIIPKFPLLKKLKTNYIRLVLKNGFLHKEYRKLYTKKVVEYSKQESSTPALALPNEPYTPEMQSITLDYRASTGEEDFTLTSESDFLKSEVEFFHITPFGQRREHRFIKNTIGYDLDETIFLLHQYPNVGELYIGIENADAESEIPILFQLAEGSANPESERVELEWEVLAEDHWKKFDETEIVSDTTNNLVTSGIIRFTLPKEATDNNTLLDSGYYWIRTYLKNDVQAVCRFIELKTNACLAEFENNGNDLTHLKTSLPAGLIKKLLTPETEIKKVTQPYSSFEGSDKESDESFYTRVSERLRHKGRAINIWDHERVILQQFPNIHKVKCIPHCSKEYEFSPGNVTIVLIPNLANKNAVNKLQPKVDKNTIDLVNEFITKRTSFFVNLNVQNPEYEEIKLDFYVKMKTGFPFGYYSTVLQQDIIEFLCPWLLEKGQEISFEGSVHKSVLLHYIEKREYVDYLTDFKMYHIVNGIGDGKDVESANATRPASIIISSPSHIINSI